MFSDAAATDNVGEDAQFYIKLGEKVINDLKNTMAIRPLTKEEQDVYNQLLKIYNETQ